MIDEDEVILLPLTRGYSRHLVTFFDSYNADAKARIAQDADLQGDSIDFDNYTYNIPDNDPLYCWAREEEIFTNLMTENELAAIFSKQDAISQGMLDEIHP